MTGDKICELVILIYRYWRGVQMAYYCGPTVVRGIFPNALLVVSVLEFPHLLVH